MNNNLPLHLLHELFAMDDRGVLTWKIRPARNVFPGKIAGATNCSGYRQVRYMGKVYLIHRIVFAMTYGRWPTNVIDHINGVRDGNRPCNLREASCRQNMQNSKKPNTNKSGTKGVCWHKKKQRWRAYIRIDGWQKQLGSFRNIDDAKLAYEQASKLYHGQFGRLA